MIDVIKNLFNKDNAKHPKKQKKISGFWESQRKFGHKTIKGVGIIGRLRKK